VRYASFMRRAVIAFLLCVVLCSGQSDVRTKGLVNGRFWLLFANKVEKMNFVLGAQAMAQAEKQYEVYFPANLRLGEITDAVDKFYSQTENLPIPIVGAFTIVAMRANGTPEAIINSFIEAMRSGTTATAR
jgi:hypothetical protein